jgi:putative acetyltransferase
MIIREYRAEDAPLIAKLFYDSVRELGPLHYTPGQVAAWAPETQDRASAHARAADGRTTLVAVYGSGEVLAYGDLEGDGHIDHLYCRPDAAGAGVGSRLLDALLERADAAGMSRLYVEASELARGLFERKGFTLVLRRDFELRGVAIHNYEMERRRRQGHRGLPPEARGEV